MTVDRVVVIGATGQLGSDVVDAFSDDGAAVVGLGHDDLDIADAEAVREVICAIKPSVIVNTAAFHNLDRCDEDEHSAYLVNAIGARNVARAAVENEASVIHISTDYVFDGTKGSPYAEGDLPMPLNVYGASKLAGEHMVLATCPQSFVVRTSGVYGPRPCRAKGGLNFPSLMLKLAKEKGELTVVSDEFVGPTYSPDLARQLVRLADTDGYGVIHATGVGETSWHNFAKTTLQLAGLPDIPVHESNSASMVRKVRRPGNSVLAMDRLRELGVMVMRPWAQALEDYVRLLETARHES